MRCEKCATAYIPYVTTAKTRSHFRTFDTTGFVTIEELFNHSRVTPQTIR